MSKTLGGNMVSKHSFIALAITLLAGSLLGQGKAELQKMALQQAADVDKRAGIAEELVRSRESRDHELHGELRRRLVEMLKKESVDQLELRRATDNLVITANAIGATNADLAYTTLPQPCRILDTRLVAPGKLTSGNVRSFVVVSSNLAFQGGNAAGCGVPYEASVAMINFVAVSPDGPGNLKGSGHYGTIPATGSILNYQLLTPTLNIANGLLFPICDRLLNPFDCSADIKLQANGGATHVVADVVGYARRFPVEQAKGFIVNLFNAYTTDFVANTCVNYASSSTDPGILSVSAPVNGKLLVRATVQLRVVHNSFCGDDTTATYSIFLARQVTTNAPVCTDWDHSASTDLWILKCGVSFVTLPLDALFPMTAGTTVHLAIDGTESPNSGDSAQFWYSNMTAQFIPD